MANFIHIDVLICTYQRASLDECLLSVLAQKLPVNVVVHVIVADNATTDFARTCVSVHSKNTPNKVTYVHAPACNISIARNACLDRANGDYIAFIDDDEVAPCDWLAILLRDMAGYDAVFGPVIAQYPSNAPIWIVGNDFHSTTIMPIKEPIITGYAGNVMLRWGDSPWLLERFNLSLGSISGEDTEFFNRLHHMGANFGFSPLGFVSEPVEDSRLNWRWLAQRRFRCGQSYADIAVTDVYRIILAFSSLGKSIFSAMCMLIHLISAKKRGFWFMRCLFHLGVFTSSVRPSRNQLIMGQG